MNAVFENDATKGPGHGFIRLGGLEAIPDAPTFSLQRAGDHLFLGIAGWQEAEEQLAPSAVSADEGTASLNLSVSPAVVDQLDPLETYRITLHGGGSPARATLRVEHVVLSPLAGSGNLQETRTPVKPAAPAVQAAPIMPDPKPEPEPLPMPEPTPAAAGIKWILPVVLAVALLGGGAAGWWYWQGAQAEKAAVEKAEAEKAAAEKVAAEKAEAEKLAAEKAAAEKAAAEKPVISAKEQARAFLRGKGSSAEAVTLANTLPKASTEDQDAVFLLMEMAAQSGNPEAMLALARYYSPADTAPAGSIIKDPEQAALWLKKAAESPETAPKAKAAIADLKGWIEKSEDPAVKQLLKTLE